MKKEKIKVLTMRCSGDKVYKARLEEIENTLEAKQAFVGGTIQNVVVNGIDIICNDDGKNIGLPLNRAWVANGMVVDVFVGNILACRHDAEGNYTDILESDIPIILSSLQPIIFIFGGRIIVNREDELPDYENS